MIKGRKIIAIGLLVAMACSAQTFAASKKKKAKKATAKGTENVAGWTLNKDKPIKFDWYMITRKNK